MRRLLPLLSIPCLYAAEVRVDQPDRWYDPAASHHYKHTLVLGAPVGLATWCVTSGDRPHRYILATLAAGAVGAAYEIERGRDGSAYIDPCDAAWTALGGPIGAALGDLTGQAIDVLITPDRAAVACAWRF